MPSLPKKFSAVLVALALAGVLAWLLVERQPARVPRAATIGETPAASARATAIAEQPVESEPQPMHSVATVPTEAASSEPVRARREVAAMPLASLPSNAPPGAPVRAPAPPAPADELAATARMFAAHAPLRTPEVADPDSAANKAILQTMVFKALAQPAQPPPHRP